MSPDYPQVMQCIINQEVANSYRFSRWFCNSLILDTSSEVAPKIALT
jgi:hypothetical protein